MSLRAVSVNPPLSMGAARVTVKVLPLNEWEAIPTFSTQRNTAKRAKDKFNIRKLTHALSTHLIVSAVVLPDGKMMKLDGHTRTEIWKLEGVPRPESVVVVIHHAGSLGEAKMLYESIDERRSSKSSADAIYSAMREEGFEPVSPLISSCEFSEAMNIAGFRSGRGYKKDRQTRDMMPILRTLDTVIADKRAFPTPVTAAALLSIMRDGAAALPFWKDYMDGRWSEGDHQDTLTQYIANAKWGKVSDNIEVTGRCLAIYLHWTTSPADPMCVNEVMAIHGETVIRQVKSSLS